MSGYSWTLYKSIMRATVHNGRGGGVPDIIYCGKLVYWQIKLLNLQWNFHISPQFCHFKKMEQMAIAIHTSKKNYSHLVNFLVESCTWNNIRVQDLFYRSFGLIHLTIEIIFDCKGTVRVTMQVHCTLEDSQ